MKPPVIRGTVNDKAQLKLEPQQRVDLDRWLGTLVGEDVDVIVKAHKDQRSLDQNAYLHAEPFPKLAKHFNCSVEQVKFDLMGECWGWVESKIAPGRMVPFKPSTSSMTVEECTFFIDWLIPWAATDHGVEIMLPDEWHKVAA